jgi:hypothetical protein
LSVIVIPPVRFPTTLGVKVTLTTHESPGERVLGQLCDTAKSPLELILLKLRSALPVLLSVIDSAELAVPMT